MHTAKEKRKKKGLAKVNKESQQHTPTTINDNT
jgi:hypothetical protein